MIFWPQQSQLIDALKDNYEWGKDYSWHAVIDLRPEDYDDSDFPFSVAGYVDGEPIYVSDESGDAVVIDENSEITTAWKTIKNLYTQQF